MPNPQPLPPLDPAADLAQALYRAFDHFNSALFGGELRRPVITICSHKRANGYFRPLHFFPRGGKYPAHPAPDTPAYHEISIRPESMPGRSDLEILSTLVHEMAHQWQQDFGHPSRNGYHNTEWANKMREIGLEPTSAGQCDRRNPALSEADRLRAPIGKATGQRMSHFIIPGARFEYLSRPLLSGGFALPLHSMEIFTGAGKRKPRVSKVCFACPQCGAKAWGKPDSKLICGRCNKPML